MRLSSIAHLVYGVTPLTAAYFSLNRDACAGVDGEKWEDWSGCEMTEIHCLSSEMANGSYRGRKLLSIEVEKPSGGTRPIGIPCLRDKVAQLSFARLMQRFYRREFEAERVDMIFSGEKYQFPQWAKQCPWLVKLDIRGCFDAIQRKRLSGVLRRKVSDARVVGWVEQWAAKGLPQGLPCSPVLASIYLRTAFDGFARAAVMRREAVGVSRYADDALVGFGSKRKAREFLEATRHQLSLYGLEASAEKSRVIEASEGVEFIGLRWRDGALAPSRRIEVEGRGEAAKQATVRYYEGMGVANAASYWSKEASRAKDQVLRLCRGNA